MITSQMISELDSALQHFVNEYISMSQVFQEKEEEESSKGYQSKIQRAATTFLKMFDNIGKNNLNWLMKYNQTLLQEVLVVEEKLKKIRDNNLGEELGLIKTILTNFQKPSSNLQTINQQQSNANQNTATSSQNTQEGSTEQNNSNWTGFLKKGAIVTALVSGVFLLRYWLGKNSSADADENKEVMPLILEFGSKSSETTSAIMKKIVGGVAGVGSVGGVGAYLALRTSSEEKKFSDEIKRWSEAYLRKQSNPGVSSQVTSEKDNNSTEKMDAEPFIAAPGQ